MTLSAGWFGFPGKRKIILKIIFNAFFLGGGGSAY